MMSLLALPDELHLEIVFYLDPYSTLRLSKASAKFFHVLRTPERMKKTLLFLEKNKARLFHEKRFMFPCYGCLKVCSVLAFPDGLCPYLCGCPYASGCYLFFGHEQPRYEERRCVTCDAVEGGSFAEQCRRNSERELPQWGTPSYSSESEDETGCEIGSGSDNASESEDELGCTEETESAIATECEDEAEN